LFKTLAALKKNTVPNNKLQTHINCFLTNKLINYTYMSKDCSTLCAMIYTI